MFKQETLEHNQFNFNLISMQNKPLREDLQSYFKECRRPINALSCFVRSSMIDRLSSGFS
jgi:hypothetical protein